MNELKLYLTYTCNLNCKYCYESRSGITSVHKCSSMKEETALKAVDLYLEKIAPNSKANLIFHGGEPLLYFNTIRNVINYANKLSKVKNVSFNYSFTSNGILIDKNIVNYLKENNNVSLSLSLDGQESTHNLNRRDKYGQGSFNKVMKGLKMLMDNNCDFSVRLTITPDTIKYLENNVEWLIRLGVKDIRISLDFFECWDNLYEQVQMSYEKLIKIYLDNRPIIKIDLFEGKIVNFLIDGRIFFCNAGYNKFVIGTEGELYPCSYVVGNDEFIFGTLKDGVYTNKREVVMDKYYDFNYKNCDNCEIAYFCQCTKCGFMNYLSSGYLNRPNNNLCNHEKILYGVIQKLVDKLYNDKDEWLLDIINSIPSYVRKNSKYIHIRNDAEKYFIDRL